jgi:hypothetical protein
MAFFEPFRGYCGDYADVADMYLERRYDASSSGFRGVFPSWDNTARCGSGATMVLNGSPENYEFWLSEAIRKSAEDFPNQERFVFINAWNEWAEGCHLEPDRKFGHRFLEATQRAQIGSSLRGWTHTGVPHSEQADIPRVASATNARPKKSLPSRFWRKIKRKLRPRN